MKEQIDFVKRSKHRTRILKSLDEYPQMPSELSKNTGITPHHVSHTLRQLKDYELIVCINPEVRKGRIYKLTDKGEKVLKAL